MATLIERNDVINYLRNEVPLGTFMKRTMRKADEACWSICTGIITKVPRVDAEPVRHGKWIPRYIKIAGQDYKHGMQCSVCAEPALDVEGDDYLTDYCPWCGTRMDAE